MKPLATLRESLEFIHSVLHYDHVRLRTPAQLRQLQLSQFRKLLRHAYAHSPFYRQQLQGLDLTRCQPADVPILNKPEMMANFDDLVTDRRITKEGLAEFTANPSNYDQLFLGDYSVCQTSGSQGQPAFVVQDRKAFLHLFAMQIARGHALPKTVKELVVRLMRRKQWVIFMLRPGFFPSSAAFNHMPAAVRRFAKTHILYLTDPFEENIRRLNEIQPDFITGYVHVLEKLARAEERGELRLRQSGRLQLLVSMSEPLYAETRGYIEKVFGVHVSNHYAMGECMGLTLGCPVAHGSHLNQDLALLEVVDKNYQPVPDGQPGDKVLVTNLYNYVQPIIRYEVDDVLTFSDKPCPCGNNMPLITSIPGRNNDRLWVPVNGEEREVPRFMFQAVFLPFYDLAEFQVVQTAPRHFKVLAQAVSGKKLEPEAIRQAIHAKAASEKMAGWFDVDVELVPEIKPDPRSGKKRRYVNLLKPQNLNGDPKPAPAAALPMPGSHVGPGERAASAA